MRSALKGRETYLKVLETPSVLMVSLDTHTVRFGINGLEGQP